MREPDPAMLRNVERYYSDRVREHGATARGVDWNSEESQELRFDQLATLWTGTALPVSILDFGCGYGALVDYLTKRSAAFTYQGFDISDAMLREARSRAGANVTFTGDAGRLARADYVVASGIFNVRLDASTVAWEEYVRQTLDTMARLATRGYAFNALTSYSDPERRRDNLHYADPGPLFDYCKRRHSRFVTLLHDYPLYEFTIIVRHNTGPQPASPTRRDSAEA